MGKIFKTFIYSLCLVNIIFLFLTIVPQKSNLKATLASPISEQTNSATKISQILASKSEESSDYGIYNILLLGLDARAGQTNPRCDAIHIFSFSPTGSNLIITSIPRGTRVEIKNAATESAYLANNCHINGIEATIAEIEKIADLKIDAYATIGFSQVLGLMRTISMPTTQTLQYLRNRRYAIGDNQRSHNQAVFIKDMILSHFEQFYSLPKNIKQIVFNSVDTNISFETADYLLNEFAKKKIYNDPDRIILVTKPTKSEYVKEEHYDVANARQENLQKDPEYLAYQKQIEGILSDLISKAKKNVEAGYKNQAYNLLKIPVKQQLWMQIEDETKRDEAHFNLLKLYIGANPNQNERQELVDAYKEEMNSFNKTEYSDKIDK